MTRETVYTERAPKAVGPYSQAVKAAGLIFVAGQIPLHPETGQINGFDAESQTRQALDNLGAILEAGDSSFENVVKLTLYLENLSEFDKVNEILEEYFGNHPPARETVEVSGLPRGAKVEISAIALTGRQD